MAANLQTQVLLINSVILFYLHSYNLKFKFINYPSYFPFLTFGKINIQNSLFREASE